MTIDPYLAFARYNRWMNRKVYDAAARLSDDERKQDRAAFFRSIHGVMNHILVADRIWLGRLAGHTHGAETFFEVCVNAADGSTRVTKSLPISKYSTSQLVPYRK
jgi:uncharacterized damage-inducible protein DinB